MTPFSSLLAARQAHTWVPRWPTRCERFNLFFLSCACPVTRCFCSAFPLYPGLLLSGSRATAFTRSKKTLLTAACVWGKCQRFNQSLAIPSALSLLAPLPFLTSGFEEVVVLAGIREAQVVSPAVNWRRHFLIMTTAYT